MHFFSYRPNTGNNLPALPFSLRAAGYYTPQAGFVEENDGKMRKHCGFFWCQNGEATFELNGKTHLLSANQMLYYYPYAAHRIEVLKPDFQYYWMTFDGTDAVRFLRGLKLPETVFYAGAPPTELWDEALKSLLEFSVAARYRGMELVCTMLARAAIARQVEPGGSGSHDQVVVERMQNIIRNEYSDPGLDLNRIAQRLQCHRTTLTRIVRKVLGITPSQLISGVRLQAAMHMLGTTTFTAAEISEKCGFSDPGYFSRKIRALTGAPPHRFRSRNRT